MEVNETENLMRYEKAAEAVLGALEAVDSEILLDGQIKEIVDLAIAQAKAAGVGG